MPSLLISGGPIFSLLCFGLRPPLVGGGGGLVYESFGKADLPLTCHPSPRLTSFALRSSEVASFVRLGPIWGL